MRTADFWDLGMVLFEFLAKIIVEKLYMAGVGRRFKKFVPCQGCVGHFFKKIIEISVSPNFRTVAARELIFSQKLTPQPCSPLTKFEPHSISHWQITGVLIKKNY